MNTFVTLKRAVVFCFFAAAMLVTISCKKNVSEGPPPAPENTNLTPDFETKISSSVSGFVTDENNNAVTGATVQVGTVNTSTTDKYGYFEVKNVEVVKNAAVVTITKAGYFKGIKTYIAASGKAAFFRIKLLSNLSKETVSATAGGKATLNNGLSISLPANAVVTASSNSTYTGTVYMAVRWLDPTSKDLPQTMPGDLRGVNNDGKMQILTTYGMVAVELTGEAGELLQMAPGKKAGLSFPIPSSLLSTAPASIPLWYFDEAKGLWKEEGIATKTGSNYVGEVSHFSFWNCDVPNSYVQFNCTLVNEMGKPLQNVLVKISEVGNVANANYGYTDSAGYTGGAVPNNAQLLLEVLSDNYNCTSAIYKQNFTTTTQNISLNTISINVQTSLATISGTVTNCANTAVKNGYVIIKEGFKYSHIVISNGIFNRNTILCAGEVANVSIIAQDADSLLQSDITDITLKAGVNNIGNIQACVNTAQFINYTIDGINYAFIDSKDTIRFGALSDSTQYSGYGYIDNHMPIFTFMYFWFRTSNIAVGSKQNLITFESSKLRDTSLIKNPILVNITEYGPSIGDFISGNFSGTLETKNTPYRQHAITCSFRIRRRYF